MAKSDAFYIRAQVTAGSGNYAQQEIDLGSFVNLGVSKSTLLRVHSVQVAITDGGNAETPPSHTSAFGIGWQLTTETQSDLVFMSNKSVVASGLMAGFSGEVASGSFATQDATDQYNLNPSDFMKGYLIGVDSVFLGTECNVTLSTGDYNVDIILECTLETATQASATALALSQQ